MQPLYGRVAIVTGAGGGLGRQHARLLGRRGAAVVVNDIGGEGTWQGRPASNADAVVDEIRRESGRAIADYHSVCSTDGAEAIVGSALDAFGRVDVVVNNAGVLPSAPFDQTTDELFDEVIDVNLRGAFRVSRAAWPAMRDQRFGRIVNTTSNSGLLGIAGSAAYGAAKAGLFGLTRVLAIEGAAAGRVARFFLGLTPGHYSPDLTVEEVDDHFDGIVQPDGYSVFTSAAEESRAVHRLVVTNVNKPVQEAL